MDENEQKVTPQEDADLAAQGHDATDAPPDRPKGKEPKLKMPKLSKPTRKPKAEKPPKEPRAKKPKASKTSGGSFMQKILSWGPDKPETFLPPEDLSGDGTASPPSDPGAAEDGVVAASFQMPEDTPPAKSKKEKKPKKEKQPKKGKKGKKSPDNPETSDDSGDQEDTEGKKGKKIKKGKKTKKGKKDAKGKKDKKGKKDEKGKKGKKGKGQMPDADEDTGGRSGRNRGMDDEDEAEAKDAGKKKKDKKKGKKDKKDAKSDGKENAVAEDMSKNLPADQAVAVSHKGHPVRIALMVSLGWICVFAVLVLLVRFDPTEDGLLRGPVLLFLNPEEDIREDYYAAEILDNMEWEKENEMRTEELDLREEELDDRESELDEREDLLLDREDQVETFLEEINSSDGGGGGGLASERDHSATLAKTLALMQAAQAAQIIAELDIDKAIQVCTLIAEKKRAPIFAAMDPDISAELADAMIILPDELDLPDYDLLE